MSVFVAKGVSITHPQGHIGMLREGDCADCLSATSQKELLAKGKLTKDDLVAKQAAEKQAADKKAAEKKAADKKAADKKASAARQASKQPEPSAGEGGANVEG